MTNKQICICGGGSLGHVMAGYLAAQGYAVNILTGRPGQWNDELTINAADGRVFGGELNKVSDNPPAVIPESQVVFFCLPGYANRSELEKIRPYLSEGTFVGCVFSSTGFFFEALNILPETVRLFGFQRVPFIARTTAYGRQANLLGYKSEHKIAIERASDEEKESFRSWLEAVLGSPVRLLANYLEASITNSNPLLHTSRLYTMFRDWHAGISYPRMILFYEEWTEEAADLYIRMDGELSLLLEKLPVTPGFLPRVLDYYESHDAVSLRDKLSSIQGFKGITSPMKEDGNGGWIPDFQSRYFTEDFGYSLRYIWELAKEHDVDAPFIDMVYKWGREK